LLISQYLIFFTAFLHENSIKSGEITGDKLYVTCRELHSYNTPPSKQFR
jgi:hypothetical protein